MKHLFFFLCFLFFLIGCQHLETQSPIESALMPESESIIEIEPEIIEGFESETPELPSEQIEPLELISGEDPNITTIQKYYSLLSEQKLLEAYDMYQTKSPSFEVYSEWYKDTTAAHPYNFSQVDLNTYEFVVSIQENSGESHYRVITEVVHNKFLQPIVSERIFGEIAYLENRKAYAKLENDLSLVMLVENDQEVIIEQADDNIVTGGLRFSDPQFSPKGNYLVYTAWGWEYSGGRIYNIKSNAVVLQNHFPDLMDFSPDEKFLITCASNEFAGEFYGLIYSVPDFEIIFNIATKLSSEDELFNSYCEYNKNTSIVRYELGGHWDWNEEREEYGDYINPKKVIEISLPDITSRVILNAVTTDE